MIPILYEANETQFRNNGIGRLSDSVSCTVTEVRNGEYELEMEYPITGAYYSEIDLTKLIYAIPADGKTGQPFEIYDITKPLRGIVTIYARHISYRLNKITVGAFTAASCAAAMVGLKDNSIGTNPFSFWTDKVVSANFTVDKPSQLRGLLGGQQGSILDVYGKGDYEFDMFTVKLHQNRGVDSGVTLRYGKNIIDLTNEANNSGVYTGIVPYYYQNETLVALSTPIYGEHRTEQPYDMVIPVDLTDKFGDTVPTQAQLRTAGQNYLAKSEGWQINTNIKVSFVNLADTEEYKDISALQRVNLCDTVNVYHEALGVDAKAQVVKTVYNVLLERYDSIELGSVSATLGEAITESVFEVVPTFSAMEQAIINGTNLITGNAGGYVVLKKNANGKPEELLVMDTENINTATKVWRFNNSGLGYSNTGYNGTYKQAWTIDGAFYTDWVTAGRMTAALIKTGTLTLGGSGVGVPLLEVRNTRNVLIGKWDSGGIQVLNGIIQLGALTTSSSESTGTGFRADDNGNVEVSTLRFYAPNSTGSYAPITADDSRNGALRVYRGLYVGGDNATYRSIIQNGLSVSNSDAVTSDSTTVTDSRTGGKITVSGGFLCKTDSAYASQATFVGSGNDDYCVDVRLGLRCRARGTDVSSGNTKRALSVDGVGYIYYLVYDNGGQSSDERLKEDIKDLPSSDFILQLRPVEFKFKKDEKHAIHNGFIAQEVRKVAPWLVDEYYNEGEEYLLLRYQEITAGLVDVVQKQEKRISELEERLSKLEEKING